jgi:thiamine biosynthesis lipoprotein
MLVETNTAKPQAAMNWCLPMKKYGLTIPLLFITAAALCPAQPPVLKEYTFTEPHMGTEFKIVFYTGDDATAKKAAKAAFARVAELDLIMSDYKKNSELMRLCEKAGGGPVKVSEDLFKILSVSQEISKRSGGAFDVTVGPVVRLWRKARKTRELPDPQKLRDALAKVGYENIQLDPVMRTIRLLLVGMLLDLGAIAKGYAADAILDVLRQFGITRALAAASGDIAVGDPPPGKKGWKIAIGDLKNPNATSKYNVLLANSAISTAGDLNQSAEIDGVRYSHIIDPKTGMALTGRMSVTVVAKDCTTTDGLDTTVCVLGVEKGMRLIEDTPTAAALIMREGKNGAVEVFKSKRFSQYEYHDK